eukprot:scaffold2882_cov100-Isochrysis_galbana.AAC.5
MPPVGRGIDRVERRVDRVAKRPDSADHLGERQVEARAPLELRRAGEVGADGDVGRSGRPFDGGQVEELQPQLRALTVKPAILRRRRRPSPPLVLELGHVEIKQGGQLGAGRGEGHRRQLAARDAPFVGGGGVAQQPPLVIPRDGDERPALLANALHLARPHIIGVPGGALGHIQTQSPPRLGGEVELGDDVGLVLGEQRQERLWVGRRRHRQRLRREKGRVGDGGEVHYQLARDHAVDDLAPRPEPSVRGALLLAVRPEQERAVGADSHHRAAISRESSEGAHAGRSVSAPPLRPPPRLARAAAAAFAPDPPAGSATGSPPSPASGRPSPSGAACTVRSAPGLFILTHSPPRSATTAHGWLPSRVKLGWKAHATGRSCARSIPPLVLCGPALRTRSMSWAHRNLPMVECTSAAATAEAPSVQVRHLSASLGRANPAARRRPRRPQWRNHRSRGVGAAHRHQGRLLGGRCPLESLRRIHHRGGEEQRL